MKHALAPIGLALMFAVAGASAAGATAVAVEKNVQVTVRSGEVVAQRKDVDAVSQSSPRSGPSTPVPYCSPGDAYCQ